MADKIGMGIGKDPRGDLEIIKKIKKNANVATIDYCIVIHTYVNSMFRIYVW